MDRAWPVGGCRGYSLTSPEERALFVREWKATPGPALEIGTFQGVTASQAAKACPQRTLTCIDIFQLSHPCIECWLANQRPNMHLFVGTATEFAAVTRQQYGFVWLDAGHLYDECLPDFQILASALMLSRATLCVHDYTAPCFKDHIVRAASEVLQAPEWCLVGTVETTAIFKRGEVV